MQGIEQSDSGAYENGMTAEQMNEQASAQAGFSPSYHEQKYGEPLERDASNMAGETYYQVMNEAAPQLNGSDQFHHVNYVGAAVPQMGLPVDASEMQAAAIMNQGMFYNSAAQQSCYSQYSPMFSETNPMYNVHQYYGGVPMGVNPYYDPYGIINPLASAAASLSADRPKKRVKKFLCC